MAAKQGLTAQLSQASEDAKRAVLSRAGGSALQKSTWFSNLNTTCTIKSAPPRTPEVLNLLSTKSGYLLKRNEQHVWQARWCCVVPHMFLYYFDSPTSSTESHGGSHGNEGGVLTLSAEDQEALNEAVRHGYGPDKKLAGPRSSLNSIFTSSAATASSGDGPHAVVPTTTTSVPPDAVPGTTTTTTTAAEFFQKLQPAGIIDLECYTAANRSTQNPLLWELAGDETINPDLRSFYFCATSATESEDWTQALLSGRHNALLDEKQAYVEVCHGFSLQLQDLHDSLDKQEGQMQEQREHIYRIRSNEEQSRRQAIRIVEQALERGQQQKLDDVNCPFGDANQAYLQDLTIVKNQDMGVAAAVQLLSDYTAVLESNCIELAGMNDELANQVESSTTKDDVKAKELQTTLEQEREQWKQERESMQLQLGILQKQCRDAQQACQDGQQDLNTLRMEFKMYQSSTRSKLLEARGHKKILKKEVVTLRQKVEECESDLADLQHVSHSAQTLVEEEQRKSDILEKYVERMENQVKVQQNMMEMISSSQGGSTVASPSNNVVVGEERGFGVFDQQPQQQQQQGYEKRNGSSRRGLPSSKLQPSIVLVNTPSAVSGGNDDDSDDVDLRHLDDTHSQLLRKAMADDDNKSHMSELTEDRTQRHFEFAQQLQQRESPPAFTRQQQHNYESPSYSSRRKQPPPFIGFGSGTPESRAIASSSSVRSLPPRRGSDPRRYSSNSNHHESLYDGAADNVSLPAGRLSVAQRSRLEAHGRGGTPVNVRLTPPRRRQRANFLKNLGHRVVDAIDNSVLGIPEPADDEDSYSSSRRSSSSSHSRASTDMIAPSDVALSSAGGASSVISLSERQTMQRAKQIAFLKEQGLLKDEAKLVGGAGAASPLRSESEPSLATSGSNSAVGGGGSIRGDR